MIDLTGKRVIITGGASGMGAGLVRAFPRLGATVVSLDIAEESGRSIAADAGAAFETCDVSDPASVEEAFADATARLGGLDVLIHAAAIAQKNTPAQEIPADDWSQILKVNTLGTLLTNQAAYERMRDSGGRIINFASGAGMTGYPMRGAYAASKGAVLAWVRTAAIEWAPSNITVNAICPLIWTPMYDLSRSQLTPEQLVKHEEQFRQIIPLGGKLGDIDQDLVPAVAFVASDASRFMTGQMFCIDGGRQMVR